MKKLKDFYKIMFKDGSHIEESVKLYEKVVREIELGGELKKIVRSENNNKYTVELLGLCSFKNLNLDEVKELLDIFEKEKPFTLYKEIYELIFSDFSDYLKSFIKIKEHDRNYNIINKANDHISKNLDNRIIKTIIMGFPGVGKSTFTRDVGLLNDYKKYKIKVSDSDSSKFPKDENWPKNYIDHIESLLLDDETSIIFTSTHKEVREGLVELVKKYKDCNIRFNVVYPSPDMKEEYLARYKKRGSSESFIKLMDENFETWVEEIRLFVQENISYINNAGQSIGNNVLLYISGYPDILEMLERIKSKEK